MVVFSDSFGAATSPSAGNRTIWGSNHSFLGGFASYDYSYSGNSLLFDVSAGASPMPGGDLWGGSAYGDGIVRIRYEGFPMLDLSAGDMAVSLIGNADANVVSLPPSATATTSIAVRLWSVDGGSSSASRVNMSVTGEWTVNGPQFIGDRGALNRSTPYERLLSAPWAAKVSHKGWTDESDPVNRQRRPAPHPPD
jgi:hypothetical protein